SAKVHLGRAGAKRRFKVQGGKHVDGTGTARCGTVSVLCDLKPGGRCNDRGCCRNIKRLLRTAARADDIDAVLVSVNAAASIAKNACEAVDLVLRDAFVIPCGKKIDKDLAVSACKNCVENGFGTCRRDVHTAFHSEYCCM